MDMEKVALRLALLKGIEVSATDLQAISAELQVFDRMLVELELFSKGVPWIAVQVHGPEKGTDRGFH